MNPNDISDHQIFPPAPSKSVKVSINLFKYPNLYFMDWLKDFHDPQMMKYDFDDPLTLRYFNNY